MNAVEHLYAAFPALLYLNASLAGAALVPLLKAQDSLQDQAFASQDIGMAMCDSWEIPREVNTDVRVVISCIGRTELQCTAGCRT